MERHSSGSCVGSEKAQSAIPILNSFRASPLRWMETVVMGVLVSAAGWRTPLLQCSFALLSTTAAAVVLAAWLRPESSRRALGGMPCSEVGTLPRWPFPSAI